ncbi:MAG: TonB-dependent receptor [Prevotellaceae bacterium]|jgi:TonB-linked SusC/RagA family outer membrane protein|nr:TonB-dependent receptor [Prevotellaceae bacterium]
MKKVYILLSLLLLTSSILHAQAVITGKVVDDRTQEPMPGVTVTSSDKKGAITNANGGYSISVGEDAALTFSFIGYESQVVKVAGQTVIDISMQEGAQEIETIVVVGAAVKKSDLTGAVGSVSSKVLEEKPVTTINDAIQGRVAGVFISSASKPGDDSKIQIRGTNTINSEGNPIYVVDGLVMDGFGSGFNSINVNDVASIQVLKDASATALYGSRGANGVVLVTTKKGRAGVGKVSYDAWFGIQQFANKPAKMNTKQLYELRKDAYVNGYVSLNGEEFVNEYIEDIIEGTSTVFAPYEKAAYASNANYDWLEEVTQPGFQQDHSLSFTGGSEKNSYFLSFNYSSQDGLVKETGLTKYTGRINAEQEIKPWLKVGTNSSFIHTDDKRVDDGVLQKAWNANPMLAIDPTLPTLNYQDIFDQNYFNPIRSLMVDDDRARNRMLSNSFLNINPVEGLNIRTSFAIDYMQENRFKYTPRSIYEAIRYSQDGQAEHTRDSRMVWQWDNSITYDKTFGKHKINALFGTSATRTDRDYTYATGKGFGTDLLSYHRLNSAYKTAEHSIGSEFVTSTLMSYILRANYGFDERYLLTVTTRFDGSSKFAEGKQWGVFPSVSGAWDIAKEAFMQDQQIFSNLKLRLGYGVVGNQGIPDFSFRTLYDATVSNEQVSFTPQGRRGNPDVTWEKQQQGNLGLDMAFLDNRIQLTVDAFIIKNKDLLMTHSLPATTGFKEVVENIGAIENKGVEFSLNANILRKKDFNWNFAATLSLDRNKVTQLYGDKDVVYDIDENRNIKKEGNLFIGESRNTIYIWRTGGIAQVYDFSTDASGNALFQGNPVNFTKDGQPVNRWNGRNVQPGDLYPQDANRDGVIDENDRVVIGSSDPKFYGGFSTDCSWKGISLNMVFTYSYGAKKLSPYYEGLIGSVGSSAASPDLLDRWTKTNTGAEFPRPITGFDYSHYTASNMDFSVQDASFLRLSALTLAYTFPSKLVNMVKLSSLRLYFTGSNLFCITPYKGFDPESGDWYPSTRMYVFGLNVSF